VIFAIVLALLLAGCAQQTSETVQTAENTPVIDRDVLFGNPEKAGVQISADGTKISFLSPVDGVLNVWVAPVDAPDTAVPVTNDTGRGIRTYFWAFTNNQIIYLQDKGGDENWRAYVTDVNTKETRDLTPLEGVQVRILKVHQDFPNEIMIGLNDRNPQLHDVYRLNIDTGDRKLAEQNDQGFLSYTIDDAYRVRLAAKITPDGGNDIYRKTDKGKWEVMTKIPSEDMITTSPVTFDKTGEHLYMLDSRGRDTSALVSVDLATGDSTEIGSNPRADVSDLMIHPTEKNVEAVAFTYARKEWQVLDAAAVGGDLEYLGGVADGEAEITDRTLDDKHWVVAYLMDDGPVRYYLYDRDKKNAAYLFSHQPELEELPLAHMHPVVVDARDGMKLVSYYTLPVWADPDGDGKPDQPLPMVLYVHGGPWARDNWGFNPTHQWLANRGYVAMSVNFRSSTGFGKTFVNAGDREWGAKAHDDLIDAVNWAVAQGIAAEDKVAIMGGSYGGYATLVGMTFTPETFACGVDIVGPSNLITLLESIPPYWKPMLDLFTARIGDHRTEEGRAFLTERSPLTYVDKIERPLLIGQGANDPRVKQQEADQIVGAMQAKDIPVTYVLYPDEGHGFARPENRLSFYAVAEAFLAEHLDGRYQPVGDDFVGSSIEVREGADLVAGLSDAISANVEAAD
jgi:dipeptidyl aminopeptidase/acylaminoacyl peptidase